MTTTLPKNCPPVNDKITTTQRGSGVCPNSYPAPADEPAFYGLAGDVVRAIEPHTAADPVALLGHFLLMFGNCIGRRAHFQVESARHFTNLFAVFVGAT